MAEFKEYINLLKALIQMPSFSREENKTAELLEGWLKDQNVEAYRTGNNIWAKNKDFDPKKRTLLLNSHHDTVKPNTGYTKDPFDAHVEDGKLFGLGSNDAGGALTMLLAAFMHFYEKKDLSYNIVFLASSEEEISGKNGIPVAIEAMPKITCGIVGEPTSMRMAIAEKGLMVIDGVAKGISGHAAHDNTENAIYNALEDIDKLKNFMFQDSSELLGPVKVSVTQINAGQQHNVVPDTCKFVIDVRTNECYSNEEAFEILKISLKSDLKPRSFRLNSSGIDLQHPLVKSGLELGLETYGSPTLSDQAQMPFPTIKLGPGETTRSHQADEYIHIKELEEGANLYINLINKLFNYETLG